MALLLEFNGKRPRVAEGVFLAPTAVLIGDVVVEGGTSIWFGAVLRGDFGAIRVGSECSIQDNAVIHSMAEVPTVVGDRVTVGHCAVLEGCHIGDGTIVGMNAVVLPRATVGQEAVITAAEKMSGEVRPITSDSVRAHRPCQEKHIQSAAPSTLPRNHHHSTPFHITLFLLFHLPSTTLALPPPPAFHRLPPPPPFRHPFPLP
ncbi:MAG: gamma carbonic anhydrase family protein, partial [Ardenticatenia bacterium]|nr:gamma carbonic anhydrase family protein [Ardenticatenia bacterium]